MNGLNVCGVQISNPDKIIYPDPNINKGQIAKYYADVARIMLKCIKNRPISVIRCHENIKKETFFKKHPTNDLECVQTIKIGGEEYFYITDERQIVLQAQFGTVEFHPWGCHVGKINRPDMLVFDLDPDENLGLDALREGVLNLKSTLDELNLSSTLKTSGGKGYHVVVERDFDMPWSKFYAFAGKIAQLLQAKWPKLYTTSIKKIDRRGKIFVDYLRNNKGSTTVAPYSLRARAGAPISMPIAWEKLDKIAPNEVNILNYKRFI